MIQASAYISLIFVATVAVTIFFLWTAVKQISTQKSIYLLIILLSWCAISGTMAMNGFVRDYHALPPRLIFVVGPPMLSIIVLFCLPASRKFIQNLPLSFLVILHIIRIPVELVLWWLAEEKYIPSELTFEGRNFDILSGLTAPIIYYLYFMKRSISKKVFIGWNIGALILLFTIVIQAVLATPYFEVLYQNSPNIAVAYFPIIWLPAVVVPIVLFSHITAFIHPYKPK